jgi:4-aminobutyrate aminotransferase
MAQVIERARELLDPAAIIPRVIGRYSPLHIDHGEGIYVWDVDGERYADFTSGIAVVNTGHCHPRVVAAIQDQAARIIHAQANILAHSPMLQAAKLLTETTAPNLNQVFWTNSGAEATEGAIKLAKVATGRPAIIAFRHGFNGRTHAAMAVTSSTSRRSPIFSAARTRARLRTPISTTSRSWRRSSTSW